MGHFSKKFEDIIEASGKGSPGGFAAMPGYYSGRGMRTSDLNSTILERLHEGIEEVYGSKAARNFVDMVAALKDLSATNFLLALSTLEAAQFTWDPAKYRAQGRYCPEDTSQKGDLGVDTYREAEGAFLQLLGDRLAGEERHRAARQDIAGKFIEAHGTKSQIQAIQNRENVFAAGRGFSPAENSLA